MRHDSVMPDPVINYITSVVYGVFIMFFPVDVHSHTLASTHAYSTIHDYIQQAAEKGIQLFVPTRQGE